MTQELSYELGRYQGRIYSLVIRGDPDLDDPDDFAVVVYYKDAESTETVEIARIDNADGFTHIDELYRRDQPKEPLDMEPWEAVEYLTERWKRFAEQYREVHDR